MISAEILIIVISGLAAVTLYSMYRYFENQTDNLEKAMHELVEAHNEAVGDILEATSADRKQIELLEQKIKDGLQNNAICHKSAIEQLKKELERLKYLYEKQMHGSISVVMPRVKEERKSHAKKESK